MNGTRQAAAATAADCGSLETRQSRFLKASQWRPLSNELLVSRGATERHQSAIHGSKTPSDLRPFLCKCATLTRGDFFPRGNIWCLCVVDLLPSCLKSHRVYIPQFGLRACFYSFGASLCSSRFGSPEHKSLRSTRWHKFIKRSQIRSDHVGQKF